MWQLPGDKVLVHIGKRSGMTEEVASDNLTAMHIYPHTRKKHVYNTATCYVRLPVPREELRAVETDGNANAVIGSVLLALLLLSSHSTRISG